MNESKVLSSLAPRNVRPLQLTRDDIAASAHRELSLLGINIPQNIIGDMVEGMGLDSNDVGLMPSPLPGMLPAGSATPIQFLQAWLPGFVRVMTAARKIDELIGIDTVGAWEDEEVIQGVIEFTGQAVPYGDHTNVPLASWNVGYARRTVVRFESGINVGRLEEARSARGNIASAAEKRAGSGLFLEIQRNRIGFYGFNNGENNTYGFLNEPSLLPAVTAAVGAGGSTKWNAKTFLEITADIRQVANLLQVQSMDNFDPGTSSWTLSLPTGTNQYLTVVSNFGVSVRQWARENYPGLRFVTAPEQQAAIGGADVMYGYPETFDDGSSDGGKIWQQLVPSKFYALGVEKRSKSYVEDYSNGTAGTLLKRPVMVVRMVGI
ncbi:major capsid family protein [Klebsiella oxytoca]|uniref:major capsid family protein n=1 Tax=Klebsiella oxytoca TaxID=571 RepID=UPI0039C9B10C